MALSLPLQSPFIVCPLTIVKDKSNRITREILFKYMIASFKLFLSRRIKPDYVTEF